MKDINSALLCDKKVIITGGSQGIGKGIVMAMANAGAEIVIQYNKSAEAAKKLCSKIKKLNQSAHALQADFTNANDVNRFIAKCIDILGDVDILVNCAAAYVTKSLLGITADDIR